MRERIKKKNVGHTKMRVKLCIPRGINSGMSERLESKTQKWGYVS